MPWKSILKCIKKNGQVWKPIADEKIKGQEGWQGRVTNDNIR